MNVEDDSVKVSTKSTLGNINEEISIELEGKELEIAFNVKFITDILKAHGIRCGKHQHVYEYQLYTMCN